MPMLEIVSGPLKGRHIELPSDGALIVGRGAQCDLILRDQGASRVHCQIACQAGETKVTDLGSRNGTLVNGQLVKTAALKHGDVVEIGKVQLRYVDEEMAKRARATTIVLTPVGEEPPKDPFVGKTLGGYRITERLRDTPIGFLYKAVQQVTEAPVGLKILPPTVGQREALVQRFLRQAKTGAAFKHPNVVQTLDAGKDGDIYYIVVEYLQGRTLQQLLDEQGEHGTLPPALVLDIMLQIGHALEYAYEHHIVHRDIRPANIIVTDDGTAKLDNLWLAKFVDGADDGPVLTRTGKAMGSLHYMAPEQIDDAKDVDCRADIYSLAATIYRALAGRPPCQGDNMMQTLAKIRREKPKSVREYNKDVPPSVAMPIDRALAKDPDERFQTPKELVLELELARKYQVR